MFRHSCVFSSLIAVAVFQSQAPAEEKFARFPTAGVELPQPEGFAVSKRWEGLEHAASGSSVVLVTLAEPYVDDFTDEQFEAEGMTLEDKFDATIAGQKGVLLKVSKIEDGVELRNWWAAFGDRRNTTMIIAVFSKEAEADISDVLKSIVIGARAIDVKRAPLRAKAAEDPTTGRQGDRPEQAMIDKLAASRLRRDIGAPSEFNTPEDAPAWEPHRIPDDRPKEVRLERGDERKPDTSRPGRDRRTTERTAARTPRARAARLPRPKQALPEYKYAPEAVQSSSEIGNNDGDSRQIVAPDGGVLVGMRVVRGTNFGGSVQAIAPIFQVANRYDESELQGEPGDDVHILLAPPGFAVGGVQLGEGAWTDAVRLVYMRVNGNKLTTDEREYSEWIGGDGGKTSEILSDGSLVVGIASASRENIESLGLQYVSADEVSIENPASEQKPAAKSAEKSTAGIRVWKSAGGKHSIEARLGAIQGGQAKLVTSDGRTISVPVEKLSNED